MTGADWPEDYDKLLRRHLPLLGVDDPLAGDASLADLGMDPLGTVALLVELEESYGVEFPDEDLAAETFATPLALWSVVARLRGA